MEFHELGAWKEQASRIIFNDNVIKRLVMPTLDNPLCSEDDNWFGGKKIEYYNTETDEIEIADLVGHYFDRPFIYAPVVDTRAFICLETSIASWSGNAIKQMIVYVQVIVHKDFMTMDSKEKLYFKKNHNLAGNRLDMIIEEIGHLFNGSKDFGIGLLKPYSFEPVKQIFWDDCYYGKEIRYDCSDFSTDFSLKI